MASWLSHLLGFVGIASGQLREVLLGSVTGKCYWAALLDPLGLAPIRMFFGSGRAAERKPS